MINLNLETSSPEEERVKSYLENNVSQTLADKINNGVPISKDGKPLINKKTLKQFLTFANSEARKIAAKGAQYAFVDDTTVFGWAIHYFEEDSIEGTLYTLDGTEYKHEPKKNPVKTVNTPTTTPTTVIKKTEKPQMSIFDMVTTTEQAQQEEIEKPVEEEKDDYSDCQIDTETGEIIRQEEEPKKVIKTMNTMAQKYFEIKAKYQGVVAMRLGDFYEVLGEDAVTIAEELNLTLTGRDIGLDERMPMIGFPYHAKDIYFSKIIESHKLLIVEDGEPKEFTKPEPVKPIQPIKEEPDVQEEDEDFDIYKSFNSAALATLLDKLGDDINIQ